MLIIIHHKFSLNRHLRWFLLRLFLEKLCYRLVEGRLQDVYKKDDLLHGQISNTPKQRYQSSTENVDLAQMFITRL